MEVDILGFIVAILLGALIGLQREYSQQKLHVKSFAGFRTFILIAFLGAILGFLSEGFDSILVILGFIFIFLLVVTSYVLTYMKEKTISMTTEIAIIITYIIGVMCLLNYLQIAVVLGILTVSFLTFKEKFHYIAKNIKQNELIAIVKLALISLVILPFLPNRNFSIADIPGLNNIFVFLGASQDFLIRFNIFNPYNIWLMVVFIASISFIGYLLVKFFGEKKGYGLTGFLGGLASSTAVTISMANKSKKAKTIPYSFALAVIIASSTTFLRVLFEIAAINPVLLKNVSTPLIIMAISGFFMSFIFYKKQKSQKNAHSIELNQPFAIKPAIKFGLFFFLILSLVKISEIFFGSLGLYITSIISGFADVDAITLSMASMAKGGSISESVASVSIILASMSNTLIKGGMAYYLGGKKFGKITLGALVITLLAGGMTLFLLY